MGPRPAAPDGTGVYRGARTTRKRGSDIRHLQRRPFAFLFALLVLGVGLGACQHDWGVEGRETPVHVWITAPGLAASGGSVDALVYVGVQKVVEGTVTFPAGVTHVLLPTTYVRAGDTTASAVLRGGALSATAEVEIEGETWIEVLVSDGGLVIEQHDEEPRRGQAP